MLGIRRATQGFNLAEGIISQSDWRLTRHSLGYSPVSTVVSLKINTSLVSGRALKYKAMIHQIG